MSRQRNTIIRRALAVVSVVAMLLVAFAAGRASVLSVSTAANEDRVSVSSSIWTVRDETVGRSLTFSGRIKASTTPGPIASAEGVVTAVRITKPRKVTAGETLYSVNLRPVVAGQGSVPGFRDLGRGDRGADVAQVRRFLCGQGWKSVCGKSETFDHRLSTAVMSWQKKLGVAADGVVRSGDILWFPSLPVRIRPTNTLEPGKRVTGGERPFTIDAGTASLELRVSRDQAALVPVGAPALVGEAPAVVARVAAAPAQPGSAANGPEDTGATDGAGEFLIDLVVPDSEQPFCVENPVCAELIGERSSAPVDVVIQTVPERTGPAVPVSAIETDTSGQTRVRTADGEDVAVTVVAVAGGIAIVDGLALGDRIVVP